MSAYRYYLIDSAATPIATHAGMPASDDDAIAAAQQLLTEHAEAAAIEIWCEKRFVAAMRRNGERYTPRPAAAALTLHPLFDPEPHARLAWQPA